MRKTSDDWLKEGLAEVMRLVLDLNGRSHCPKLYAIDQGYKQALAEEQAERIREAAKASAPIHCSRHFSEVQ